MIPKSGNRFSDKIMRQKSETMTTTSDPLDDYIAASARVLALPVKAEWQPAVKANLDVTLKHAALVAEFELPDDAEPAPIFTA
jgi:hypothetical protein